MGCKGQKGETTDNDVPTWDHARRSETGGGGRAAP